MLMNQRYWASHMLVSIRDAFIALGCLDCLEYAISASFVVIIIFCCPCIITPAPNAWPSIAGIASAAASCTASQPCYAHLPHLHTILPSRSALHSCRPSLTATASGAAPYPSGHPSGAHVPWAHSFRACNCRSCCVLSHLTFLRPHTPCGHNASWLHCPPRLHLHTLHAHGAPWWQPSTCCALRREPAP